MKHSLTYGYLLIGLWIVLFVGEWKLDIEQFPLKYIWMSLVKSELNYFKNAQDLSNERKILT